MIFVYIFLLDFIFAKLSITEICSSTPHACTSLIFLNKFFTCILFANFWLKVAALGTCLVRLFGNIYIAGTKSFMRNQTLWINMKWRCNVIVVDESFKVQYGLANTVFNDPDVRFCMEVTVYFTVYTHSKFAFSKMFCVRGFFCPRQFLMWKETAIWIHSPIYTIHLMHFRLFLLIWTGFVPVKFG